MTQGLPHHQIKAKRGLIFALSCHLIWGSMPLYLLLVRDVPVLEYVAWRTLVTVPLCVAIVLWRGDWPELRRVLRDARTMRILLCSAALIGLNWLLYVWAIQSGYVYAASLGYYILPLTMMLLGMVFLGERLRPLQWAAVGLAALGVGALALGALTTLWLSVAMAISFGTYGLLRKTVDAGPLIGLTVEALVLTPFAIALLGWLGAGAEGLAMGRDTVETIAILAAGPMTAAPLIMFAAAARILPYTLLGFIQFISPTIVFIVGLLVFKESLNSAQLACFVAIWLAACLFIWEMLLEARKARRSANVTPIIPV